MRRPAVQGGALFILLLFAGTAPGTLLSTALVAGIAARHIHWIARIGNGIL